MEKLSGKVNVDYWAQGTAGYRSKIHLIRDLLLRHRHVPVQESHSSFKISWEKDRKVEVMALTCSTVVKLGA